MSLTAQTTRTILAALALCFLILASADKTAAQREPKVAGGSTVRGVVTYADTRRPLRTARIDLVRNEGGEVQASGITDYHGEFLLEGIPAGRYIIVIDSPGILLPQSFRIRQSPIIAQLKFNNDLDPFTTVVVNGTDSIDVKVRAVRGGVITGRVVTHDDQPLPKADVKLLRKENGKWVPVAFTWTTYQMPGMNLKTDPSGVYRIAGLPTGEYLVRVSEQSFSLDNKPKAGDVFANGLMMTTYYPSATSVEDAQPVSVIEGSESTGIDIRLPDLMPREISGKVLGPENEPGGGARIRIDRADEIGYVDEVYDTATYADKEGNWRIAGVPAGEYVITVTGPIQIGAGDQQRQLLVAPKRFNVRVDQGDVVAPDVKMSVGAMISGKITLDGKAPKHSYPLPVDLVRAEVDNARKDRGFAWRSSVTGGFGPTHAMSSDGTFQWFALPAGRFWLEPSLLDQKFYLKSVTRKGVDLMQKPIRLKDDLVFDDVVVTLATDFASLEGEIVLPEGQPKSRFGDVIVMLAAATEASRRNVGEPLMMQADAQGKFSFICPPGEYFIAALSATEIKKLRASNTDDYFKNDKKFTRVKVRGAEKLKGVRISID